MQPVHRDSLLTSLVFAASFVAVSSLEPLAANAQTEDEGDSSSNLFEIEGKPTSLPRQLRFQVIGRDQGLPQNTVSSIAQDSTGFIWLGTDDGLARYDGSRFRVFRFKADDDKSLSSSSISKLLVSSDGTLWIGTTGGGINRLSPDRFSFERFGASDEPNTLNEGTVLALVEGSDARIWIGTNGGGLSRLDPKTGEVFSYSEDSGLNPVITSLYADPDGSIWAGTAGGLYRFDPKEELAERILREEDRLGSVITAITRDAKGDLWIGTDEHGVARVAKSSDKSVNKAVFINTGSPSNPLAENSVRAVFNDSEGRIWIGTPTTLHLVDPDSGRVEQHSINPQDPHSLPGQPREIFQDKAGAIWVATLAGGAAIVDQLSLKFNYFPSEFTTSLFAKGDQLLVGTAFGVCRYQGRLSLTGECFPTGVSLGVFYDSQESVWVGTETEGLFRLKKGSRKRWTVFEHQEGASNGINQGMVVALHEDRKGRFWVGGLGGGLQQLDRSTDLFSDVDAIASDQIFSVQSDPADDDVLWVSTADAGLFRLDVTRGTSEQFLPRPEDSNNRSDNSIPAFLFDGQFIWLATYGGGLKRLDPKAKEFKSYTRSDGLPSDTVYSLAKDKSGKLWMGTVGGLARFDPSKEEIQTFSVIDGVQSDEFSLGVGGQTGDGRLFFGGLKGFNVFDPADISIDQYKAPVVITGISVLGEPINTDRAAAVEKLSLGYDESFIDIEFAALGFSGSGRTVFDYKVDGLNDRWFRTTTSTLALPALKDGDYTLLIRARNRHGVISESSSLRITIAPPLWRTWWAYASYALIVFAMLFGIYRYQQVRIIRLEKLARLATVEKELDVTANVQSWFLPPSPRLTTPQLDLVGFYRAADKSSGDWWWYEELSGQKLWVIIADVTGHGAGPAMMTAAVAMGLRVQSDFEGHGSENLVGRLERVNKEVLQRAQGRAHMTMTALEYDATTGHAHVFGVGGLPAVLLKTDGKHSVVNPRGNPIGSGESLEPGVKSVAMNPGERLMLLTDGLVETVLPSGKAFGFRRFAKLLHETRMMPLDQAVQHMASAVDAARAGQPQDDDFTFCVIERRGS